MGYVLSITRVLDERDEGGEDKGPRPVSTAKMQGERRGFWRNVDLEMKEWATLPFQTHNFHQGVHMGIRVLEAKRESGCIFLQGSCLRKECGSEMIETLS